MVLHRPSKSSRIEQTEPMRRVLVILLATLAACGGATVAIVTGKDSGAFCQVAGPFLHTTDISAVLTDPAAAEARVKELRPVVAEARRKAPPEIKADVERVATGVESAFDALAAANYQTFKVDRDQLSGLIT